MQSLAGVVFDLDNTLTDNVTLEAEVWQQIAELVGARMQGVEPERLRERYAANLEPLYAKLLAREIDMPQFQRQRLIEATEPWGVPDSDLMDDYLVAKRRLVEEVRPAPGAAAALESVRAAGLRVGVLTNGLTGLQRDKLDRVGLAGSVDAFVTSEQAGRPKPHGEAFAAIAAALDESASVLAMVGDDLVNDIEGALAAGFAAAVWVIEPSRAAATEPPPGALVVDDVGAAPAALGV